MRTYPLQHEPGEPVSYGDADYILVGRLAERLTGESPNRYLRRKLLDPLRLLRDGGRVGDDRILSPAVTDLLTRDQGFSSTMGFGYRAGPTPYGQGPRTLQHVGDFMTYFWLDPRPGGEVLEVFLSQRLSNIVQNNNMAVGMRAIFHRFVPLVYREMA